MKNFLPSSSFLMPSRSKNPISKSRRCDISFSVLSKLENKRKLYNTSALQKRHFSKFVTFRHQKSVPNKRWHEPLLEYSDIIFWQKNSRLYPEPRFIRNLKWEWSKDDSSTIFRDCTITHRYTVSHRQT